ncbi:MAG TPA: beta-L-arabinofuranosidase domain-containing protein [Tichowtungia sp.]|nr:beta-L-arabinofuranosidase domain-containing protein [Tichowtungia sp.]
MPQGWILEQLNEDLDNGYYPKYDTVNHTVTHDLFVHKNRRSGIKYQELRAWWSGEHEGYWKDGTLRMAFLAGHEGYKDKAIGWLDAIVAAQGTDGYIGIYAAGNDPGCRFHHKGENGELWVQSRIFQALIAGYEFTGNEKYLNALIKAVDCTIRHDPGNYFNPEEPASGGVSHGVGFFDALWYLTQRKGGEKYAQYAVKLYRDFNDARVRDDDLTTENLLSEARFQDHGAHIAEGFYVPAFIADITEDKKFSRAARRAFEKLQFHLTPGGAMVCAENVKGEPGSGRAGYEYCGIAEHMQVFPKLIALTGDAVKADVIETMVLNAGQGARFPVLTALAYVSKDNRLAAHAKGNKQRHAYGAYHEAAACCTLNGGRVMPYYVEGMWMRSPTGLVAPLFGPCIVQTELNGTKIQIEEKTDYPFSDTIQFIVTPEKPVEGSIMLRVPAGAGGVSVTGVKETTTKDGWLTIHRVWKKGDRFSITFDFPVTVRTEVAGREKYIQRGPLVYALPFQYERKALPPANGESLNVLNPASGFSVYDIDAVDSTGWEYRMADSTHFKYVRDGGDRLRPFADSPISLQGTMVNENGDAVEVELVPIGCTVLRRTTFPPFGGE